MREFRRDDRSRPCSRVHRLWSPWAIWPVALAIAAQLTTGTASAQKYRSDDWITECAPAPGGPECSIIAPVAGIADGEQGSFALVVALPAGDLAIVGQPSPTRAVLHIGRHPPIECRGGRYCVFPHKESQAAVEELNSSPIVLVDVYTARSAFRFSLTARGYRAGIAEIRAWGYRFFSD